MNLLLDTHIWIWYLSGSKELPTKYRKAISSKGNASWLSPISVWETMVLAQKGRLTLLPDPVAWVREALRIFPVTEAPLNVETSIRSRQIPLAHEDPADRFLAATALVFDLTLMTVDRRLTGLDWLPVLRV